MLQLGIALSRLKRIDEAKEIAKHCRVPMASPWGLLYDSARLQSLLGDSTQALALLRLCFESTPPSRLAAVKQSVKAGRDFDSLKGAKDFGAVLQTASKVSESACSGGTSCGSCPNRASCGSGETKSENKKESGSGK